MDRKKRVVSTHDRAPNRRLADNFRCVWVQFIRTIRTERSWISSFSAIDNSEFKQFFEYFRFRIFHSDNDNGRINRHWHMRNLFSNLFFIVTRKTQSETWKCNNRQVKNLFFLTDLFLPSANENDKETFACFFGQNWTWHRIEFCRKVEPNTHIHTETEQSL